MKRYLLACLVALAAFMAAACDSLSTDPGSFVVVFQWETGHEPDTAAKDYYIWAYYQEWKGGEGKEFPADIETNAKSLDEAGPVKLGSGESLNFTKLTYGDNRFVRAAVWDNEERTGDPLYVGVSELFDFSADDRNKTVAVNMKLQANAGVDETGEAGSFAVEVRYDGVAADRVPVGTVTLRFTVKNADTVIIANDLNFEKGPATLKLADLTQIDETTYEYGPWDITTGWDGLGDTTYSVFGKSRNKLGYESGPQRADVYLDTTAPVPNITPFPAVAKLGDTITVRFSFDEEVDPADLILKWSDLAFALADNKENKSYTYSYTVGESDFEHDYSFILQATDAVGNQTDIIDLGVVTIDRTPPQTGAMTVTKNGVEVMPSSNLYLKDGDELALSIAFSEKLGADPLIRLGMHELTCVAGDENAYDCSLTIDKTVHGDTIADLTASFEDVAGNGAVYMALTGVRIDSQPPQISFQKNKQTDYNATDQIVYTLTTNEALATLTVDGVVQEADRVSWTFTGENVTGDHQVLVIATDLAGNIHPEAAIGTYRVDATYPTATIGTPTPNRISGTGTVTVTVNEPSEPIENAKINGVVCAGTLGNYTCTYDAPTGTGDEVQTLTVTFDDPVGNTTTVTAGTVYIDRTAPVLALKKNKEAIYNATDQIVLTVTASEELAAVTVNGTAQDPGTISWNITGTNTTGDHEVTASATDLAGNTFSLATIGTYTVDADYPTATIGTPTPARIAGGSTATISLSNITETLVVTLNGDAALCEKNGDDYECTYTATTGTGDKVETLTVTYADEAGNVVTETAGTVYVDRTAPTLTAQVVPGDKTLNASETLQITVNASEELDGNPTVALLDSGNNPVAPSGTETQGLSFIYTYPTLTDGTYHLTADGSDITGHAATQIAISGIISDSSIPEVNGSAGVTPDRIKPGDAATITFTADEPMNDTGDSVVVKVGGTIVSCTSGDGLDYECTYTATAGANDSIETISITLTDASANGTTTSHGTIYVDRTAPRMVSRLVTPTEAKEGTEIQVLVIFDEPVTTPVFSADGLSFTRTDDGSDPQRYSYYYLVKGVDAEQSYALTLTAVDSAGNPVADTAIGSFVIDLTTPAIAGLHVCHDDATDDPCAADETTFSAVAGYREMKISFSLSEAADTLAVELGDTDITGGNCTAFAGPSYVCTATVIDTAAGSNPRMEGDLAKVTAADDAGNGDFDSKSLVYDFLPPDVTGTAFFTLTAPEGCPLVAAQVTEVTNGTVIRAQFALSEPLAGAQADEVTAVKDAQDIPFTYNGLESGEYVMVYTAAVSGLTVAGEHTFTVALTDLVGNEATVTPTVSPSLSVDVAIPGAPDTLTAGKIVYRRIPWGSNATSGMKYFSITAGENAVDGDTVAAVAYEMGAAPTPEQSVRIGMATVVAGTFPDMKLDGADRTQVHLVAWDGACNHSGMIRVNDIEWIATTGYKIAGSTMENPHLFTKTPRWLSRLTQDPTIVREATQEEYGSLAWVGGEHMMRTAEQSWADRTGDSVSPTGRAEHAMVYDRGRGTVVLFGGSTGGAISGEIWEYDGEKELWTDRTPVGVNPSPRYMHGMVYDSRRGTVMMFGGGGAEGMMNDVWEWDGNAGTWTERPITGDWPGARYYAAMAYDSRRGKVVMFGGYAGMNLNDVWEWDGETGTWDERTDESDPPPARITPEMIYDSTRGVMMMFGGKTWGGSPDTYFNDIWEWRWDPDQGKGIWTDRTTAESKPEGRHDHSIVYDRSRERLVLYGGRDAVVTYDDLWEWAWDDDQQKGIWTERTDAVTRPGGLFEHAMACDDVRGRILLFGGYAESHYWDDLWEWDGDAGIWIDRNPATSTPPERAFNAIAYDSDRGRMVLFGGMNDLSRLNDTWEWDTTAERWIEMEILPADRPPVRLGHALAYDSVRKVTVLFGGDGESDSLQDTWEWDGTAWDKRTDPTDCTGYPHCTVCTATTCPSVRNQHAMVYDVSRGAVVVFGGYYYDGSAMHHMNDIWEWDGDAGIWVDRTPASGAVPEQRKAHAMAYDSDRGVIMMYGGGGAIGYQDLWEWDGDGDPVGEGKWFKYDLLGTGPGYKSRHVMAYDTARRKTLLYGGESGQRDLWEWDAATDHWEKRTPTGINPVGREFSAMAYDTVHEQGFVFGGRKGSDLYDDTWKWNSGTGGRPAGLFAVRFAGAQANGEELVSLTVNFTAGGSAYSAAGETGAGLWIWDSHPGAWRPLNTNGAEAGAPDQLSWATDDPAEIARLLIGNQQTINLTVAPVHPNGTATQLSEVAVDYAEVVVRYRLP